MISANIMSLPPSVSYRFVSFRFFRLVRLSFASSTSRYYPSAADASLTPLFRRRRRTAAAEVDRVAASTVVVLPALPARALTRRQPLDHAVARQHASIDREVAADHERPHRRVLLRQPVGLVGEVGLVLAAVDQHEAGEPRGVAVRLVQGVSPSSTPTQAWRMLVGLIEEWELW